MNAHDPRAAVVAIGVFAASLLAAQTTDVTELFDGSLDGWSIENSDGENFSVVDGFLQAAAPAGWLKSGRQYADFELDIEFRFMTDDADSGIFLRTSGNEQFFRGWPSASYQVQLRNPIGESPFPPIGGIFRHGMEPGETDFDEAAARASSLPTGQWQRIVIRVVDDELGVELNDVAITTARDIANASGYIGIQGETGAVQFRSIEIREL